MIGVNASLWLMSKKYKLLARQISLKVTLFCFFRRLMHWLQGETNQVTK